VVRYRIFFHLRNPNVKIVFKIKNAKKADLETKYIKCEAKTAEFIKEIRVAYQSIAYEYPAHHQIQVTLYDRLYGYFLRYS
jgi:hypothetical protein